MSAPIKKNVPNPNGESLFLFLLRFVCFSFVLIHLLSPYSVDDVDVPVELNLDDYVWTADFDHECHEKALTFAANSSSEDGSSSEDENLWSSDDSVSSATTAEPSLYEVPKLEANLYYAGVGPKGRGPKLIYRTSDDIFEPPSGPEAYKRLMRVITVPDAYKFTLGVTWDQIRDQVHGLLVTQQLLCSHFVLRL